MEAPGVACAHTGRDTTDATDDIFRQGGLNPLPDQVQAPVELKMTGASSSGVPMSSGLVRAGHVVGLGVLTIVLVGCGGAPATTKIAPMVTRR